MSDENVQSFLRLVGTGRIEDVRLGERQGTLVRAVAAHRAPRAKRIFQIKRRVAIGDLEEEYALRSERTSLMSAALIFLSYRSPAEFSR